MNSARYEYGVSLTVPVLLNFALVSAKYLLHTLFWWYTQPLACCFNSLLLMTIRPAEKLTTALGVSLVLVMKKYICYVYYFKLKVQSVETNLVYFPPNTDTFCHIWRLFPKDCDLKGLVNYILYKLMLWGSIRKSLIRKSDCSFVCSPWVIHFF